jgi:hypothetical protein
MGVKIDVRRTIDRPELLWFRRSREKSARLRDGCISIRRA